MQFSANQINQIVKGEIVGDASVSVWNLAKIEEAKQGDICFIANPKYESFLYTTQASVIIVNKTLAISAPVSATLILVDDAYSAFSVLLAQYEAIAQQKFQKTGVEQGAFVHPTAKLGNNVYIAAFAYIGEDVVIGDDVKIQSGVHIGEQCVIGNKCMIHSGVKIYHQVKIGHNVILHANAVIGSDGFGFAPQADGSYQKIAQTGNVIIEDDVEIGANTCIDRATMGSTIIQKGVKLDNLIQIAHNVEIGAHTVIAAQTGVSGSTKIDTHCVFGGQVGVAGHITIAKGSKIGAKAGVNTTLREANKEWNGNPIMPYKDWLKSYVIVRRLSELKEQVNELEKQLATLHKK